MKSVWLESSQMISGWLVEEEKALHPGCITCTTCHPGCTTRPLGLKSGRAAEDIQILNIWRCSNSLFWFRDVNWQFRKRKGLRNKFTKLGTRRKWKTSIPKIWNGKGIKNPLPKLGIRGFYSWERKRGSLLCKLLGDEEEGLFYWWFSFETIWFLIGWQYYWSW